MKDLIRELNNDHEIISQVMSSLEGHLHKNNFSESLRELQSSLNVLSETMLANHHEKEEKYLYDWMIKQNKNSDKELIRKLVDDHKCFEVSLQKIKADIEKYLNNSESVSIGGIGSDLNLLVVQYKEHLDRESNFIFYIAETLSQKEKLV